MRERHCSCHELLLVSASDEFLDVVCIPNKELACIKCAKSECMLTCKSDHGDSLPDTKGNPRGDTPVKTLHAVLLVNVCERAKHASLHCRCALGHRLHLQVAKAETFSKFAQTLSDQAFAPSLTSTRTTSMGWFHVPSAPPIELQAILSIGLSFSDSSFPLSFLTGASANRAKPILRRAKVEQSQPWAKSNRVKIARLTLTPSWCIA